MKNILILASGSIAKNFIEWISQNRVAQNQYFVTCHEPNSLPEKIDKNVIELNIDPTSFSKLKQVIDSKNFTNIFIVMKSLEDVKYVLKNISLINPKLRLILVNQWGDVDIGVECENITIIHRDKLIASHLYEQLPNVPLVAQNVGLGRGEIMEIHVPFGSAYSYRHIGSILQKKWKIVTVYRKQRQILPNSATMIRPNDTLLVVGKPAVLDGVYKMINKRVGLFPEPFGKNIYLILDFKFDKAKSIQYLREAIYLIDKLEHRNLFVRVLHPNDFKLLKELKSMEKDNVSILVSYKNKDVDRVIESDILDENIGLIMSSIRAFEVDSIKNLLYDLKKLILLFGDDLIFNIKKSIVLMSKDEKMEAISSTAFDVSELLSVPLTICSYKPEGDFENRDIIIEHYETLAQIFNTQIKIERKITNPIRELSTKDDILQVAPFDKDLNTSSFKKIISKKVEDFLLITHKHPKLLVPYGEILG